MTTENSTGHQTYQATAVAIAEAVRVTLDSDGLISAAGATANWIGVTRSPIAASGYGEVKLRSAPGSVLVTASGAVTCGAKLYPTASGKVDDAAGTGNFTGLCAKEAATASGDIIEAVPADYAAFTASADQDALTDNTGGSVSNATLAVVTAPTALTDSGGGTADGTVQAQSAFAASVGWNGSSVYPSAADEAALTAIALAARNNMKEFTTSQAANRLALVALTDDLAKTAELVNALRTALVNAGIIKGAV